MSDTDHTVEPLYPGKGQWWAINGEVLWAALVEVAEGCEPAVVFQRLYEESQHENVTPEERWS